MSHNFDPRRLDGGVATSGGGDVTVLRFVRGAPHVGEAPQPRPFLVRLVDRLVCWQGRLRTRRSLADLDDRMLRDIGLTRGDVRTETEKPFWRP